MGIKAACGSCEKTYSVGDENAGKRFKCKACGGVIAVPGGAPARKTAAPAVKKICVVCGKDVSQSQRTKDTEGNYYCPGCYESAKAEAAAAADPFAGDGIDLLDAAAAVAVAEPSVRTAPPPLASPSLPAQAPPVPARASRRTAAPDKAHKSSATPMQVPLAASSFIVVLVLLGLTAVISQVYFLCLLVAAVLMISGGIRFLVVAFRENSVCGIMVLFVPFYSLYYLATRWSETKNPFLMSLAGNVLMIGANMIVAAKGGGVLE